MSYKTVAMRKSMRKKQNEPRSWPRIILVFILCASLLFAVGILLGNFLKSIAGEGPTPYPGGKVKIAEEGYFQTAQVPVILASCCDPQVPQNETPSDGLLGEKSPILYNAGSLTLRTVEKNVDSSALITSGGIKKTGMHLCYTSEFSTLEPFDEKDFLSLDSLLGDAKKQYTYISGTFALGFFREPEVTKYLVREYEISLLCELSRHGLDDVVLTGVPEANLPDAIDFIRLVTERTDGRLKLGIAMPFAYFDTKDIQVKINALHYDCGFFALDLRSETVPTLMTPENFVYDRIGRIASTVSLYSVRVIVGIGPIDGYLAEAEAAFKAGSLNIMTIPKE